MKILKAIGRVGKGGLVSLLTLGILVYAGTEFESNNDKYNANSITQNSTTTGTTTKDDVDFFKFKPTMNLSSTMTLSNSNNGKLSLLLMKGCGWDSTDLQLVTATSAGETITLSAELTSGQEYCVQVKQADSNNEIKNYELKIESVAGNNPPIANDKTFTTSQGVSVSANLMTSGGTKDSDLDGDTLSASKTTNPSHGSVTIKSNGDFTYTPTQGYSGTDTFTYTVSDGRGGTDTGTVRIGLVALTPSTNNSISLGCGYHTGLSVFDDTGTVSLADINTKIHQGDDNYFIGVNKDLLFSSGGGKVQCKDSAGNPHECVGNNTYAAKIDLGIFPDMPVEGESQYLNSNNQTIDPTKNKIYMDNTPVITVIKSSKINNIHTLSTSNAANLKLVNDGGVFYIKNFNFGATNQSKLILEPGTYYIENLSIQSSTILSVEGIGDGSGTVRLLVKNAVSLPNGSYNYSGNDPYAQSPEKLFIASYTGDISVASGTNISAYLYSDKGKIWINGGSTNFVGGAAGNNISFQDGGEYYYLKDHLLDGGDCNPPSNAALDAWDQDANPSDRHIRTKIVGKPFILKIAALDENFAYAAYSESLKVRLVETASCPSGDANLSGWADIDLSTLNPRTLSFIALRASKDAKVQFQVDNNATKRSCSTDNFAIRPERLALNSTDTAMPNLLRAGENYNLSINAYDYNTLSGPNTGTHNTLNYSFTNANTLLSIATKLYDKEEVERNASTTPVMYGTLSFNTTSTFDMENGISVKTGVSGNDVAGVTFDDVGKVGFTIQDHSWAMVDNDDTLQSCDSDGAYVCGDKNVTFIPDHFDFETLSITNNNGNPGTFTYIANEMDQMAARIHTNIRALNKNNNVSKNFAKFPLYENDVTIVPVVRKSTYRYPDANESNITNLSIGFVDGNRTIVWNESNVSTQLRFNFQRDINQTASPFDVNGSDLNISISSDYVDVEDGESATIIGVKNQSAEGNSTFVYGRIVPRDIRIFGQTPFVSNAWYEVFDAPTLNATNLPASKNDARWYINTFHNDANSGDGNVTVVLPNTSHTNTTSTAGVEIYRFTAIAPTYTGKGHIDTAPWLWYGTNAAAYQDPANPTNLDCQNHPCFDINVVPPIIKTGSAKSNHENVKNSKSSSGGGAWKSTSDYAPAIR